MLRSISAGVVLLAAAAPAQAAPRMLVNPAGALTGPSGQSRTAIARGFLGEHGFGAGDLGSPVVQQTPRGVTIVSYRPSFRGVPTFAGARVVVDRSGRVVETMGSPPARVGSVAPRVSAADAVAALRRRFGERVPGAMSDPTLTFYEGRLAWDLTYGDYHVVVDASDGGQLFRASRRKHANDATIYPLAPGASPARDVTFADDWLEPDAATLNGAHAHVWSDVNGDHVVNPGEEVGRTAAGDFTYPLHDFTSQVTGRLGSVGCGQVLCTWDSSVPGSWRANREQDAVQAFYLVNTFHDHLAEPTRSRSCRRSRSSERGVMRSRSTPTRAPRPTAASCRTSSTSTTRPCPRPRRDRRRRCRCTSGSTPPRSSRTWRSMAATTR
jgi:extracellular elastinolytic metalloproteinase